MHPLNKHIPVFSCLFLGTEFFGKNTNNEWKLESFHSHLRPLQANGAAKATDIFVVKVEEDVTEVYPDKLGKK